MKKILYLLILLIPFNISALSYPELHYNKAIIYDLTDDEILYAKESNKKSSIASLTKIMTTITAIENIKDFNSYVTYTDQMSSLVRWDASVAGLKVGNQVTYNDLLYASILPSGADATTALAISTSGSIDNFVRKMNDTASKIGMTNTHFVNVTGLDAEEHYSTAEDILKLLKYSLKNEKFKAIYTTKTYTLSTRLFVRSTLFSYNGNTDRIIGSKTGFTLDAGRCISVYFTSNNHEMILITLGVSPEYKTAHITDALELIDFIDNNYHYQNIVEENQVIKTIPVKLSQIESYEIKEHNNITKYLPDDYDKSLIKIEYNGLEELSFKQKENDKIGEVKYYYNDFLLDTKEIHLENEIKLDIVKLLIAYKYFILIVVALVMFIILNLVRKKKKLSEKKK